MEYAAITDVGVRRVNNEDSYVVNEAEGIYIVADGMGGHNAGEVASREACRIVESYILSESGSIEQLLVDGVLKANRDIFIRASENETMKGMGTTIDACAVKGNELYIAHVGDSRVYVIGGRGIRKITKDHSVVGALIDAGTITEEEAKVHPQRHYITRAVGTSLTLDVEIVHEAKGCDEIVLMCTDGLTNMVTKDDIYNIVTGSDTLEAAARGLVEKAKENGGDDNITVILFK